MRFKITANYDDQCFDVRVQRGARGHYTESHQVATKDLLAWLQREITSEHFGEIVLDTQAVDTPEPRYLVGSASE